jgi:hypothetical protein
VGFSERVVEDSTRPHGRVSIKLSQHAPYIMHHSNEENLAGDELHEITDPPEPEDTELGRTGRHPDGKMAEHDEGGITFAVGRKGEKVFLNFGTRVKSLGMTPEQAKALGGELLNYARDVA